MGVDPAIAGNQRFRHAIRPIQMFQAALSISECEVFFNNIEILYLFNFAKLFLVKTATF
jgi:hypothetical protein